MGENHVFTKYENIFIMEKHIFMISKWTMGNLPKTNGAHG